MPAPVKPVRSLVEPPRQPGAVFRILRGALVLVTGALLIIYLQLCVRGLPKIVERRLLDRINSGALVLQVERLKLSFRGQVLASHARVFHKGVVGEPLFEAPEVILDLAPLTGAQDRQFVEGCVIRGGVLRRAAISPQKPSSEAAIASRFAFTLEQCQVEGVWIERCTGQYAIEGGKVFVSGMEGVAGRGREQGTFRADLEFRGDTRYYNLDFKDCRFDPRIVVPLLAARKLIGAATIVGRFEFADDALPACDLRIHGFTGETPSCTLEGRFSGSHAVYRGVAFDDGTATLRAEFSAERRIVQLAPLNLSRDGRSLIAECTFDLVEHATTFKIMSMINPREVAPIIGPGFVKLLGPFRFGDETEVAAEGTVDTDQPERTSIKGAVRGKKLGLGRIVTDEASFDLLIDGRTNQFANIRAGLWGGAFNGAVLLYPSGVSSGQVCSVTGAVDRVSMGSFFAGVFGRASDRYTGALSVTGRMETTLGQDWRQSLSGDLAVAIHDSFLFRVPLLGGLTEIVTKVIRPLDRMLEQTEAACTATLREGRMSTTDLKIDGKLLRVEAEGNYGFDNSLNFLVNVTVRDKSLAQRILRLPISILNELFFEIRLTGTLDHPNWYLKRFSKEAFQRIDVTGGGQ